MSFLNLFSQIFQKFDSSEKLEQIIEFIKKEKVNIQVTYEDAIFILKSFLPNKKLLDFGEINDFKKLLKVEWSQLDYSDEENKKSVMYVLLFILVFVTDPKETNENQSYDFQTIFNLIKKIHSINIPLKQVEVGVVTELESHLDNLLNEIYQEFEMKNYTVFEYNCDFCRIAKEYLQRQFPMDFYDGKIFNGVIYYVPKPGITPRQIRKTFTVGKTHIDQFKMNPAPRLKKKKKLQVEAIEVSGDTEDSGEGLDDYEQSSENIQQFFTPPRTFEDLDDYESGGEDDVETVNVVKFPPKLNTVFSISGRKFNIEATTQEVGQIEGLKVTFKPVLVEKMNISYMNYKLKKYIDKKDFKKLMSLSKHVENQYKHLAFNYKDLTDQIKRLARNALMTQRFSDFYIRMVGLYDEFVKDNIEILFLPDVAKELNFIHSYMQEYHFDHIALNEDDDTDMPVKQPNYDFVVKELCRFSYEQVNKERKAQGKNYKVRDKYGAQIKRFLDYHATYINKRRSIETFHIIDRNIQQSYFPNMLNNYDTSNRFKRKPPKGGESAVSVTNTDTTDRFGRPQRRFKNMPTSSKKRVLDNPSQGDPKRRKMMMKFDTSFGLETFMNTFEVV